MSATTITALATIVAALVAIGGSAFAVYLTKQKEPEAVWRAKRLAYYEEFLAAASGIVGQPSAEAKIRFANAINTLHLIGSPEVLTALHAFIAEIARDNVANFTQAKHDELWSLLVWEIRADLGDVRQPGPDQFRAILWASGV